MPLIVLGPFVSLHGFVTELSALAGKLIRTPFSVTCQPAGFAWLKLPSIPDVPGGNPLVAVSVELCPAQMVTGEAAAVGGYGGITLTTAFVEYATGQTPL